MAKKPTGMGTGTGGLIGSSYKPNFGSTFLQFLTGHGSWDDAKQTLTLHNAVRAAMADKAKDDAARDYYLTHGGQPHPQYGYPKDAIMSDPRAMHQLAGTAVAQQAQQQQQASQAAAASAAASAGQLASGGPSVAAPTAMAPMSPIQGMTPPAPQPGALGGSAPSNLSPRMQELAQTIQNLTPPNAPPQGGDPAQAPAPAQMGQPPVAPAQQAQPQNRFDDGGSLLYDPQGNPRNIADVVRNPAYIVAHGDPDRAAKMDPIYTQWKDTRPHLISNNGVLRDENNPKNEGIHDPNLDPGMTYARVNGQQVFDRNGMPVVVNATGYNDAQADSSYAKQTGQNISDLRYKPRIEGGVQDARNASDTAYAYGKSFNAASGTGAGSAPWTLEHTPLPYGGIRTQSVAQALAQPIDGLPPTVASERNQRNEADGDQMQQLQINSQRFRYWAEQIKSGALNLGPYQNMKAEVLARLAKTDPNARNYLLFKNDVTQTANQQLLLAHGTQTEGDAVRNMQGLFSNMTDPTYVQDRLGRLADNADQLYGYYSQRTQARGLPAANSAPPLPSGRSLPAPVSTPAPAHQSSGGGGTGLSRLQMIEAEIARRKARGNH